MPILQKTSFEKEGKIIDDKVPVLKSNYDVPSALILSLYNSTTEEQRKARVIVNHVLIIYKYKYRTIIQIDK